MKKDELKAEYDSRVSLYRELENEASFIINKFLDENKIKKHSVLSRIKDFESLYDKIERKVIKEEKEIKEPFAEIKDIVGLRVVCLFLSDIEQIGKLIRSSFDVLIEDNKIDGVNAIDSFGYMSLHFNIKMKKEYTGPRYDKIRDIPFEIQVRTISMDAWANISHHLSYKTETDVPKNLKRDFQALSGLFYVADTHFELFFKESKESQKNIHDRVAISLGDTTRSVDEEINLDSLKAYLLSKFADRNCSDDRAISELIKELGDVGIFSISQIEEMYNWAWDIFLSFEQEKPATSENGKYWSVGVIRGLLGFTNEKYRKKFNSRRSIDKKFIKMVDDKIASQKRKAVNHES
jgi:ppGpp synthetase/RelA/SpoT-type nucleotidyltranferase